MSEWRTIEDGAPKDGTVVLLYARQGRDWNGIHAGRWDDSHRSNGWGHRWIVAEYQNLGRGISGDVTHWMPLPPPPGSDEEQEPYGLMPVFRASKA